MLGSGENKKVLRCIPVREYLENDGDHAGRVSLASRPAREMCAYICALSSCLIAPRTSSINGWSPLLLSDLLTVPAPRDFERRRGVRVLDTLQLYMSR